jgi:DNA-binding MltR family transcriptional regulator
MAFYYKPLTYNSQVAGYLIRSYPSDWTVLDAVSKEVLKTFTDDQILVKNTNTPDLRQPGKLVQKSVDLRAIRARGSTS